MEPSCTTRSSAATRTARPLIQSPANSSTHNREDIVRNSIVTSLAAALALLVLAQADDYAQGGQGAAREPLISQGVVKMPNPPGPAPKRDLSGTWVGPRAGAPADNAGRPDPIPPMTPAG